jgi:4-amino-4-deoxy-L-arabinose transferase-like glycosyltransferase
MSKILYLIIICLLLFFSLLGLRGLCEPDEGRYAEISREIIESGDWLTPRLNYIKHFHKPPLVYWCTALSFLIFGENEFSARFPITLMGLIGVLLVYSFSQKMGLDRKTSFFSSIVLATTFQYFVWTQILSSDMVFSVFLLLAFYGFWTRTYLFYVGMAIAFMVKGPVAVIIPFLVIGLYLLISKEKYGYGKARIFKGIALFFLITTPWFIYVCVKNRDLFNYFIFYQSLERVFTSVHGRGSSIFYYIPIVFLGGMPWIVFLPFVFKRFNIKDKQVLFLALWFIVPLVFFSFSRSKLPGYILPVLPSMALLVGRYLALKNLFKLSYMIFGTFGIIYLIGIGILPKYEESFGDNFSTRKPAAIIKKYASESDKIINFRCFLQGLPFYVNKRVILVQKKRETQFEENNDSFKGYFYEDMKSFSEDLKNGERFWCFCKQKDYEDMVKLSPLQLYEIWESNKYVLVSNKPI